MTQTSMVAIATVGDDGNVTLRDGSIAPLTCKLDKVEMPAVGASVLVVADDADGCAILVGTISQIDH